MDLSFLLLWIPALTVYDIKNAKKAMTALELLRKELGMNITLKAHIMFKHTVHQYDFFRGIVDKAEDFVEKIAPNRQAT